ncbi:MAG: asparaginase [Euzebya sp.]
MSDVLVEVLRGPLVDAVHRGDLAIVDAAGTLLASVDPDRVAYMRSAAKPFQAMPIVYTGAASRWNLGPEDLAILCASHSGEPVHVDRVTTVQARIGCVPTDLACGTHPPLFAPAAAALARKGEQPGPLHHNCSGLHTSMIATARHLNLDHHGYHDQDHPVQQEILANVARFADVSADTIVVGTDGCNSPCHGLSVYRMAYAYARLMHPVDLPAQYSASAMTIRQAMISQAYLIGGTDRFDSDLMSVGEGRVLAKGGAGAVQCIGVVGGIGLALKIDDGISGPASPGRPSTMAAVAALQQIGALDDHHVAQLDQHARPKLTTSSGLQVGHARTTFDLSDQFMI